MPLVSPAVGAGDCLAAPLVPLKSHGIRSAGELRPHAKKLPQTRGQLRRQGRQVLPHRRLLLSIKGTLLLANKKRSFVFENILMDFPLSGYSYQTLQGLFFNDLL